MRITLTAADGARLVARRAGQGIPLVLVHGSAGGLDSWEPILPLLADTFELWTYARRGYVPSGDCPRSKTYADDVADLRAVLAAAGGSAHVVGASYGGTVALHAALADDVAIRSLVVFEPPLFAAGAATAPVLEPYRHLLEAGDLGPAARLFAEKVARVPASLLAGFDAAGSADEARGCLHDLEAMSADASEVDRWARVGVPVLLMQGSDTWAPMPATMDALAAALPKAERVVLAGQSHFATHTAPGLFAGVVRRFLEQ
ncbi:alpha/beta fold hydrolase [Actinoplanes sp. NPDC049599]|uniref:alpha/beta fold hydrolase n=1 Tax=Actinoplanes sp. NPDC049599 TaxID=3363903 RepID=UPI0037AA20DF